VGVAVDAGVDEALAVAVGLTVEVAAGLGVEVAIRVGVALGIGVAVAVGDPPSPPPPQAVDPCTQSRNTRRRTAASMGARRFILPGDKARARAERKPAIGSRTIGAAEPCSLALAVDDEGSDSAVRRRKEPPP
jgi:hypothetical protein